MKLHFLLLTLLYFLVNSISNAQTFEDLKAPSMSAATLIGSQVNEITSPKSLKALETSLLNNFMDSNNNIVLPDGYALEFNPFMLLKGEQFHYLDYLENQPQNLYRNISVSVASTNSLKINDSINTNALGFGINWTLFNGKVDEETKRNYIKALNYSDKLIELHATALSSIADLVEANEENLQKGVDFAVLRNNLNKTFTSDGTMDDEELMYLSLLKELPINLTYSELETKYDELIKTQLRKPSLIEIRKQMEETKMNRYGFRLELNSALGLSFPNNDFYTSYIPKVGAWMNISYRLPKKLITDNSFKKDTLKKASPFEFVGLIRYINVNREFVNSFNPFDSLNLDPGSYFDLGIRANIDFRKLNLGFEYIYRLNQSKEFVMVDNVEFSRTINSDTYKFLFNINYSIKDNIVLSYNIGKNYGLSETSKGILISGVSLNLGFGDVKEKELLRTPEN
jgi:hypothetical protein